MITVILMVRKAGSTGRKVRVHNLIGKLPVHPVKEYERRQPEAIDQVIIHHSATTTGTPEAYARYHVDERGWPGIGYHFVIQKNGTVYQTNRLDTVSYHASGQNHRSVGICLTGNYDKELPPKPQQQATVRLIQRINDELGKPLRIAGHNAYAEKSCPGTNVSVEAINQSVYGIAV